MRETTTEFTHPRRRAKARVFADRNTNVRQMINLLALVAGALAGALMLAGPESGPGVLRWLFQALCAQDNDAEPERPSHRSVLAEAVFE
jgi:hypothetical protein